MLDEPTSGVDVLARAACGTRSAGGRAGAGVLVTTHYMQEAQQCDRLVLMSNGRLVAEGSEATSSARHGRGACAPRDWARPSPRLTPRVRRSCWRAGRIRVADADPAELAEVLSAAGIEASLQPVPATIEERMLMLARAGGRFLVPARGRAAPGQPGRTPGRPRAARELFAELGFERTTMRAVATRAGVDPALIYHYFGDKDGLLSPRSAASRCRHRVSPAWPPPTADRAGSRPDRRRARQTAHRPVGGPPRGPRADAGHAPDRACLTTAPPGCFATCSAPGILGGAR